jgi:hypothetical protein
MRGLILVTIFFFANTSDSRAQLITITDFSFENPALADGSLSSFSVPVWIITPGPAGAAGAFDPFAAEFPGAGGQGVPVGGDGAQALIMAGTITVNSSNLLTIVVGTTYALTIAVGDAIPLDAQNLTLGFLAGWSQVGLAAAIPVESHSPDGAFRDFTTQYTVTPADAGKQLPVLLLSSGGGEPAVDNVRLNNVPEPSAYSALRDRTR